MGHFPPPPPASAACPETETLAAYIDHRLSAEERRALEAHLDACDACYSVFVDAVAAGHAVRGRWSRSWRWALPAAAAAAVAVAVVAPVWRRAPATSAANPVAALVASADSQALRSAWQEVPPSRGGADAGHARAAAFRLGVLDADLEIALRTGDAPRARQALRAIVSALGPHAAFYERLEARVGAPEGMRSLADEIAAAAGPRQAGLEEPEWQHGRWLGTARRAALARRLDFFRAPPAAARLQEAALAAPLEAAQALERALERVRQEDPAPDAWESLVTVLEELVRGEGR